MITLIDYDFGKTKTLTEEESKRYKAYLLSLTKKQAIKLSLFRDWVAIQSIAGSYHPTKKDYDILEKEEFLEECDYAEEALYSLGDDAFFSYLYSGAKQEKHIPLRLLEKYIDELTDDWYTFFMIIYHNLYGI